VNRGERLVLRHYRLRGYRLLAANARVGRYELDLVLRRGRRVLVVEVKEKSGTAFGDPLEMIDDEKVRRVHTAAAGWLAAHPQLARLEVAFEAAAVRGRTVERVPLT
jgi:putative endonuclease